MEKTKLFRSKDEARVLASLKIHTYIALNGLINPSLRCIAINWDLHEEEAKLIFFHDGIVAEADNWHYNCIEVEATSMRNPLYQGEQITMRIEIISLPFPKLIPQVSEIVYLRKESNFEFNQVDRYVPDWKVGSTIRLKVNEALRGKVTSELREVHLFWDDTNIEATITFFHNGEVTQEVYKGYQEIFDIATVTLSQWENEGKSVIAKLIVRESIFPEKIEGSKNFKRLYSRKEPFTNPV